MCVSVVRMCVCEGESRAAFYRGRSSGSVDDGERIFMAQVRQALSSLDPSAGVSWEVQG